jgi:hypothetical protein
MIFEKDAVILERNKRLEKILWGVAGLMVVAGGLQALLVGGPPMFFYVISLPLGLLTRVSAENWRAKSRTAHVRAAAEGVFVDGTLAAKRADIAHAVVQPRAGKKPTVRLRNKQRTILVEVEVEDDAEGAAFLRSIGHDAAAKKATFPTMSPVFATRARGVAALLAFVAPMFLGGLAIARIGAIAMVLTMILFVPLVFAVRRREVDVGADGLTLSWWTKRFIRWDEVRAVDTPTPDTVRVTLASGEKIPLRTATPGYGNKEQRSFARDALHKRIQDAALAHRARIGPRELAAQLMPGADHDAWLGDLKKLREGEGGYRAAAVREEDLWRVVEDPGAPEEARAAAAVLLRGTDGAKPRLRVAADAVASPRLRVALEAEEEEQAEEALKAYLRQRPR